MVAARQHPSCDRAQSGQLRRSHEVQSIIDLESQVLQNLRELRRGEPVHCREIRVVNKIAAMLHDPSQNAITQPRRDPRIEGEVIYLALKRVVAVGGVQKENSPGASARTASLITARQSGTCSSRQLSATTSNSPISSGSFVASATIPRKTALSARFSRCRARATNSASKSTPVTLEPRLTQCTLHAPVPQPISRTRSGVR